jgi:lantibiotic modifying enzyme
MHPDRHFPSTRRDLLRHGLAASATALLSPRFDVLTRAFGLTALDSASPYLDAALQAERWISMSAQHSARGTAWPWNPADAAKIETNLYTGTPGVVLFYLELHRATGERPPLEQAMAGADYLIATLPDESGDADGGLYTGLAGVAYTLEMTHRASDERRFGDGAARALALLKRRATPTGAGVEWSESTDIISGNAGIGLFLLWAHEQMHDAESLALAQRAGRRLVERAQQDRGGLKWLVSPQITRNYPNFSHGTAGVSYFLASLHRVTGEREFLDAARSGAAYLDALATTTPNGGRMVFHSEPGNEQLFYLGWCHGPAGTARLYHRLATSTGDAAYRERVGQLARAVVDMHVPERSPGFWNNISRCCGNCGVTEFFIDLHRATGERAQLEFAERVAQDTLDRATRDGTGERWIQAENRVQPEVVIAQTGLMQGAAGVGIAMLHLDGVAAGRQPFVVLPDTPF